MGKRLSRFPVALAFVDTDESKLKLEFVDEWIRWSLFYAWSLPGWLWRFLLSILVDQGVSVVVKVLDREDGFIL